MTKEEQAKERLEQLLGHPIWDHPNGMLYVGRVGMAIRFNFQWIDGNYRCVYPQGCCGQWTRLLTLYLYAKHDFDYLNEKAN